MIDNSGPNLYLLLQVPAQHAQQDVHMLQFSFPSSKNFAFLFAAFLEKTGMYSTRFKYYSLEFARLHCILNGAKLNSI